MQSSITIHTLGRKFDGPYGEANVKSAALAELVRHWYRVCPFGRIPQ